MTKPLAIDLFTGLHGWASGLAAEGWRVVGFDIENMCAQFGMARPDGVQLVIQNVLTLHGSQFRGADLIVASPPCQFFSYCAMPWSRAKALAKEVRSDPASLEKELALFNACFRIQNEACEAAGRHIPMIVENVRGAIPWVGRSRWNYGSFHFWGDVPALMPMTSARKMSGYNFQKGNPNVLGPNHISPSSDRFAAMTGQKVPGFRFDGSGKSFQSASVAHTGVKAPGMNWSDRSRRGQDFTRLAGEHAVAADTGTKIGGDWFSDPNSTCRKHGSKSPGRKMASAMIAKIPEPLSRHIARTFRP